MPRETGTIRTKDDRDNIIVWLLILFLFLFELGVGFLTYLTGPLLVVGKPDIKTASVVMADFNVGTTSVDLKSIPAESEKQSVKIKVSEIKRDESLQTAIPSATASTTEIAIASTTEVAVASTTEVATASTTAASSPAHAVDTYTLSYIAGDGGYLVGSTTQVVANGERGIEVTAVPNNRYGFYSWSDGSVVSTRADTALATSSNFTANFVLIPIGKSRASSLSNIATITSGTYIVSAGGTANETITGVPFATNKAAFLSAITKGQADQAWNDTSISDQVVSNDTLVVTAQNGTAVVTYTVTVDAPPPPPGGPG